MFKNVDRWLMSYISESFRRAFSKKKSAGPIHVMFALVDHYEPDWNQADESLQLSRVKRWVDEYPAISREHADADGRHPQHNFFYPVECYTKEHLDLLNNIVGERLGEVEMHLHHENDTEESLTKKLLLGKDQLVSHGYLSQRELSEKKYFGFIHGNWALNNSRKDGSWCGVNNESAILRQCGCYADFTYPSAPDETQTKKINSIYYTQSSSKKSKSHNNGQDVEVGKFIDHDLMVIQGPLALNWKDRKCGIFPRIENGELSADNSVTNDRIDLWVSQGISVKGKEDWVFVKVHTHGAPEKNAEALLGGELEGMYSYLEKQYNDGQDYILHYVSAREMYNIIKAAEAEKTGNPNDYRDYMLKRRGMDV